MKRLVGVAIVLGLGTLLVPAGSLRLDSRAWEPFCRLYLDPHDNFTRVVAPPVERGPRRANAVLSTMTVKYTGFTPQAQAAFQAAVDIWKTQVSSSVPLVIDATFSDLGSTGLLGQAGFSGLYANFTGAPLANVLYPGPIASKLSNTDRNGAGIEIVAQFNSTATWSYATDGVPVSGKVDFVSVVLHELGHGLGFVGSGRITSGVGVVGSGFTPYVYDVSVVDSVGTSILNAANYPNNSVSLAALISGTGLSGAGLFWNGAKGVAANGGTRPRLFAPASYLPGSSYSHLDDATFPAGNINSLMTHAIGTAEVIHTPGPIVNGMFADMGWGTQCSFGLSQPAASVPAGGGTVSVTLSTTAGCPWTASTAASFATVTAGSSGNASAVVRLSVSGNAGAAPRIATVAIADQTFTIAQAGTVPCSYALSPTSAAVGGAGGPGTVTLTTSAGCFWTALSGDPAVASITSTTIGTGSATVSYVVALNTQPTPRSVTLTIGGQPHVITQGASPPVMSFDRTALRFAGVTTGTTFTSQTASQTVHLTQIGSGTVTWTAASNAPWVVVSPASGTGAATLTISTRFVAGLSPLQSDAVTVTYTGAQAATGTIAVTLATPAPVQTAAPFGAFDTPANLATGLTGSIAVTGWALDDVDVARVRLFRNPVAGEPAGQIFIGDATLVEGARPDVQAQYAFTPRNYRGGWGYLMLTNFLPGLGNGTFTLTAIADDVDGHATILGTKTITCTNSSATAPFGAIDTPAQGATVSGAISNVGWVLSPAPRRADPPGGGSVQVVIDGAVVATVPTGWTSRADLTALFPSAQFPGVSSALGLAALDSRTLANGVHTISWVVTDNLGSAAGIGSRYFTVANASVAGLRQSAARAALRSELDPSTDPTVGILGRTGFDPMAAYREFVADADGVIRIELAPMDRLELQVARGAGGHAIVANAAVPLPVGSRLDPETGIFTWQPGVGFLGTFDLVLDGRNVRVEIALRK